MTRRLLAPTFAALAIAALTSTAHATNAASPAASAAHPPIYLVVDVRPRQSTAPGAQPVRRTVTVLTFDNGDAANCARVQRGYPNGPGQASSCTRTLPAEFAPLLQDGGLPKAYVLKVVDPRDTGAEYTLMYDMSTANPQQVCHNVVDYKKKFNRMPASTRIQCWVPRA